MVLPGSSKNFFSFLFRIKKRRGCTIHYNKNVNKNGHFEAFELANFNPKGENYKSANSSL